MTALRDGGDDHAKAGHANIDPYPYGGGDTGSVLRDMVGVLRRRRMAILATVVLGTTLAALAALNITPVYTAVSEVMIEVRRTNVVDIAAVVEGLPQDIAAIETRIQVLASRSHARRVVEELKLLNDPEFNAATLPSGSGNSWFAQLLDHMPQSLLVATGLAAPPAVPTPVEPNTDGADPMAAGIAARTDDDQIEAAIERVLGNLKVDQEGRSNVLSVVYTARDPQNAARIANAVADLYIQSQLEEKMVATSQATVWLAERVEELREEVIGADRAVEDYRVANQLLTAGGDTQSTQQLASLTTELINARADRTLKEARLRHADKLREADGDYSSIGEVMSSPVVIALREQKTELLREEAELAREYGNRHPRIVQLRAEKDQLADEIEQVARNVITNLENEVEVARSREQALEESIAEARNQTTLTGQAAVDLRQLEREAAASRALYENFLIRLKETEKQSQILRPDAAVVSSAATPQAPSFPWPKLMITAGFSASLMLGTVLAFLIDHLDGGLRSGREIEENLGVASFGLIPAVGRARRRQKLHRYLLDKPRSTYAEAILAVRRALQRSCVDDAPKVVLVTSAVPGEGKTTLAMSLGTSIARAGHKTVVVDLDLRHPRIASEMDQPIDADLIDFLIDDVALDDVLYADAMVAGLDILPAQRQADNPAQLIESEKLAALVAQLRGRYEYVVLEPAPALGIADTKIAALLADVVLFVARWETTTAEIAANGLKALDDERIVVAGAVLTRVNLRRHARFGFGDVGHYYGTHKKYYAN